MIQKERVKYVTYCGLYCRLCGLRNRIPRQARFLRESMQKEGYESWGKNIPGFHEFWKFMENLCDPEKACPGCRRNGGPPFCSIRKCARKRKIDLCVFCKQYPCKRIFSIEEGYPLLLSDGKRIKEIGINNWIHEQEERVKTGFAYMDIRTYPFTVPEK